MAEHKNKETIFGFPVETFAPKDEDAEDEVDENAPLFVSLRMRISRFFTTPPLLGWPLVALLWLILAVNLYDIVSLYVSREYGIFLFGIYEIPPVWSFPLQRMSAILRTIAVFGILRTKYWGFTFYLIATFSFLVFCAVPEFKPPVFILQMILFIGLLLLLRGKWELFD
jgi:hypothetical protein